MWLLITFILLWALTPGPVTVMTIHKAKKQGLKSGIAISTGASITAVFMVIIALAIHQLGFKTIADASGLIWVERCGACGIILMGLFAGYKAISLSRQSNTINQAPVSNKMAVLQGVMLMATNIPQAVIFYTIIVPQTVDAESIFSIIMALGSAKVALMFVWHSLVAVMANKAQRILNNRTANKGLDFATACLMVGLGVNILV